MNSEQTSPPPASMSGSSSRMVICAHGRLQRLHLFLGKERIQSAAIRSMVGRIEMQWRPPARERYLRNHVLNRRDERIRLA